MPLSRLSTASASVSRAASIASAATVHVHFDVGRKNSLEVEPITVEKESLEELLQFEDAQYDNDRLLRFLDRRLERRYCQDVCGQRKALCIIMLLFWLLFTVMEFMVRGIWLRLAAQDLAMNITGLSRVALMIVLSAGAWLLKRDIFSVEKATCIVLFPCTFLLFCGDLVRIANLVGSDAAVESYGHCGHPSCYDDSFLVLSLLVSVSTPLLLSVRVGTSWLSLPWTAVLYCLFSNTGLGPMPPHQHAIVAGMLSAVCGFLLVGTYRVECELRRRWIDTLKLRTEMALQEVKLMEQEQLVRDVEDRLAALGSVCLQSAEVVEEACAPAADVATYTVPLPRVAGLSSCDRLPSVDERAPLEALPNELLVTALENRMADAARLESMARRLCDPLYGMQEFFEDCVHTFPELALFHEAKEATSSGLAGHAEYQRTIGALFAVYWMVRLDLDGKAGFCFGCDPSWSIRTSAAARAAARDAPRRQRFHDEMNWAEVQQVVRLAIGSSLERLQTMLCLTAIHDIMKVEVLCPRVTPEHAPYEGYGAGETITDHDVALAYILEKYPDLLPSFRVLPQASRDVVLFTQSRMHFNHGWFVQAEAPPGPMLSHLKQILQRAQNSARPRPDDLAEHQSMLAFYFFHWLTDLSGAEGQPLAGADKFVLHCPRSVLSAFLWSIPYLQRLVGATEAEVVESYLVARFEKDLPGTPLPQGPQAIAVMRLAVMAQNECRHVLGAFQRLAPAAQEILATELARTGIPGQRYRRSPVAGGPALLVYYGPALLQRCATPEDMLRGLQLLAAILHAARLLWPLNAPRFELHAASLQVVTVEVSQLKAHAAEVLAGRSGDGKIMVLEQRSRAEGRVAFLAGGGLNELATSGRRFWALDTEDLRPAATPSWMVAAPEDHTFATV